METDRHHDDEIAEAEYEIPSMEYRDMDTNDEATRPSDAPLNYEKCKNCGWVSSPHTCP